jgi:F0F1-type ATP synthase gamma subunit
MYSKAELKKYSDAVATIKSITRVYEEAAARRIRLIQISVAKVDEFLASTADSYVNIKFALLAEEQKNKGQRKDILTSKFRETSKEGVLILISSHEQYFGNLIPNVYRSWKEQLLQSNFDGIIFGNTGKRLFEKDQIKGKNIKFYDLLDNEPDWRLVYKIGEEIGSYDKVVVFYGKYRTVLTQTPEKSEISTPMTVGQVQSVKRYLFEENGEKILGFFENEVIKASLKRRVYESQIARYAARIKILEIGQVAEAMSKVLGDLNRGRLKVRKNLNNKKQLQLYTGSQLWGE